MLLNFKVVYHNVNWVIQNSSSNYYLVIISCMTVYEYSVLYIGNVSTLIKKKKKKVMINLLILINSLLLPWQCSLDSSGCNMIPEIPEPFQCMWEDCKVSFASAQNFYWHVQSHVVCSDPNTDKVYKCFWEGELLCC